MPANRKGGRVAIVTGGAGGLGRAMTRALIDGGHRVAIVDRDADAAHGFAEATRATAGADAVLAVVADVARQADCEASVSKVVDRFGSVDILINNAGIGVSSIRPDAERRLPSLMEVTPDIWDRFIAINLTGSYLMARAAVPRMRANGWGRMINVTTSFHTMLRVLPYGATKAALEAASAVWATEFDGSGITVTVVVPGGPTDTNFTADESGIDRAKMLRPEVMGPPVRWLASDDSDGVTGRRFIAANWDPALPPAQAAARSGAPIGWPELAANVIWPSD